MKNTPIHSFLSSAEKTVDIEIAGLEELKRAFSETELGDAFEEAVELFSSAQGRIILTGIGKSGHIARKVAATLVSTGTSAMYLHPGEASHGDLGSIGAGDVVFAITWSGTTSELGDIVNFCGLNAHPLVVATAFPERWIGRAADICLVLPKVREACPNELAPTSSTTMQMVLGDAIAVALIEARGFSPCNFSAYHPGGLLGARLATLEKVMGTGEAIPKVSVDASLREATVEMSRKRYGCTAVVRADGKLAGAFTDGDLRRCITAYDLDESIAEHMSLHPVTANAQMMSTDALVLMNENAVSVLFVTEADKLVGIVHMHDLVQLGIA
ncbi:arabinose-5-phosphate isomerase [Erythrobacter litoralis]|jgi:arabinose-5-phosphate isomerase|uniref:D-arabinose 5-phosphate n=1 Tax=Erythrobacter litoralis TaxID=39960 RepID=A0A074MBA1_9SPHN|nr:KpsF/GutQ family sugar-phosphate isomerase [Erythrobacter litoralis]AOL22044.1 arabinose-5-phosphate isomerase [Erythrobacter litoralis]KEO90699.1 D-arabinose 5-phosphate [Erythrobacter litoralis]MEE4338076.1 KpsF/GutQ family sugar-phosphate isomerase [Erythrobacter sp.]